MKKRIISLAMTLCMICMLFTGFGITAQAATAEGIVARALGELNQGPNKYGGQGQLWCVHFLKWCAEQENMMADGSFPSSDNTVRGVAEAFAAKGQYTSLFTEQDDRNGKAGYVAGAKVDNNFVPQVGDFVCFRAPGARWQHIGIVYGVRDTEIDVVSGNFGDGKGGAKLVRTYAFARKGAKGGSETCGYIRPDYSGSHTHNFDIIEREDAHPHRAIYKCSACGEFFYHDDQTEYRADCKICNPGGDRKQYRYHRYANDAGTSAICPYYGRYSQSSNCYGTECRIEFTPWLDSPLPVDNGSYSHYVHAQQGSLCTDNGCIDAGGDTNRVFYNGKAYWYEEIRTVDTDTPPATPEPTPEPTPQPTPDPTPATPDPTPAPTTPAPSGTAARLEAQTISNEKDDNITEGIRLSWTEVPGTTYYRVYRADRSGGYSYPLTDFAIKGTSYVDVKIRPSSTYYYIVKPLISEGNALEGRDEELGEQSNERSMTTASGDPGQLLDENGVPGYATSYIIMRINDPKMDVNGVSLEIDPGRGTSPILYKDRTMLPARALTEAMRGSVDWSDAERRAILSANGSTVTMWIGKTEYTVNGQQGTMDIAPYVQNERTLLPLRFVTENLNCRVTWMNDTKEILIVFNGDVKI